MDRKNIAIIVLSAALIISLIGLIATSVRLNNITNENSKFVSKLKETEGLAAELSKNMSELKVMLGRAEEEKEALALEAKNVRREMKERLDAIAEGKTAGEEPPTPLKTP